VPYMLIVGDKEAAAATVSVRLRSGEQLNALPWENFKSSLRRVIVEKATGLAL
jgi:threonyl-tRNA synthetase